MLAFNPGHKCLSDFLGQDIEDYVRGPSQYPLVIHGKSGCGKTAVIALAAKAISGFMDQKCCLCLRYACSCLYLIGFAVAFRLCDKHAFRPKKHPLPSFMFIFLQINWLLFSHEQFLQEDLFETDVTGRKLKRGLHVLEFYNLENWLSLLILTS